MMATSRQYRRTCWGVAAASVLFSLACSDSGPEPSDRPVLEVAVVSNPTTGLVSGTAASPTLSGAAATDVAYVSLPPGSLPSAEQVTITNPRTGAQVSVRLVDGGFDPVAIPAVAGDTLDVAARTSGGTTDSYIIVVPARRPPIVIRTDPPPRKRDVPLNATMLVVFSEPINPRTVTPQSVRVLLDGEPVAGALTLDASGLRVEFQPERALTPSTAYQFVIRTALTDLTGDSLAQEIVADFSTTATPVSGSLIVSQPVSLQFGDSVSTEAFVSLPRGSIPTASSGGIRNRRTGLERGITTLVVDGGFDPVGIPAAAGDALVVTMWHAGGGQSLYEAVVPAASSPVILRTSPAAGAHEVVPPFVTPEVVFSEPVGCRALELWQSTTPVGGAGFGLNGIGRCVFAPAAWLVPGAEYDFVVPKTARSLSGTALESPVTVTFSVELPPPGATAAVLQVREFSVIEIQYPQNSGWYYAPQIRVAETAGTSGARIASMTFTIPDIVSAFAVCAPGTLVGAGQTADLFTETYGDYEFSFDMPGARATGDSATVVIVFQDDVGRIDSLSARGPVQPGGLPTTYSGGSVHGYGPCPPRRP